MKLTAKRTLALVLCVLTVFALLPVTADAATSYSTLSSKKAFIQYPTSFFSDVRVAKVVGGNKGSGKNGVYMVPRPETGYGDMGTVKNGSNAILLAEKNGYYFWMTTSGKVGWTSKKYFTEPDTVYSGYLFGSSGLTVSHIDEVKRFLRKADCGYSSTSYYANRAVLVMKKGETKKISVHRKWYTTYSVSYDSSYLTPKWVGKSANCKVSLGAKKSGTTTIDFTNYKNSQQFHVLIIIT